MAVLFERVLVTNSQLIVCLCVCVYSGEGDRTLPDGHTEGLSGIRRFLPSLPMLYFLTHFFLPNSGSRIASDTSLVEREDLDPREPVTRAESNQNDRGLKGSKEGDGGGHPPCSTKESKISTVENLSPGQVRLLRSHQKPTR